MELGVGRSGEATPLVTRLAWLTGFRLVFLLVLLSLIGVFLLGDDFNVQSFTAIVAIGTVVLSFVLAGAYALLLRLGRRLVLLAYTQLVVDQLVFSAIVYFSGGPSSAAVSLYGLTCVVGAVLLGMRGAATAAIAGAGLYVALVVSLNRHWLLVPPDQPDAVYRFSTDELVLSVSVNLLGLVVVMLLSGFLAERLRETGGRLVIATERAEKAERLAALGRLAAGLAHEIRNPISAISGSTQLLGSSQALSPEDRQLCSIIQQEARRLNDLVTDMINLTRPRPPTFTPVDAASVAREVIRLARESGRGAGDVGVRFDGDSSVMVRADSAQLRQLIWNLVRNAVQASGPGDEVLVRVVQNGPAPRLEVSDNGVGIDEASKDRVFDAFFTTRSQGTGIGLAVVRRIVDDHDFTIDVESARGQGARFIVHLRSWGKEPAA